MNDTATDKLSRRYRVVGMNIQGTPPMSARRVAHDLQTAVDHGAHVILAQEMRWAWYFRQAGRILRRRRARTSPRWGHSPSIPIAVANPVRAAQAVFWRADLLGRKRTCRRRLHGLLRGISNPRQLRGVLLQDREHPKDRRMRFWVGTTHFVPGGDRRGDDPRRRRALDHDLDRFDRWLGKMLASGHPAVVELDANIARRSAAWARLEQIVRKHDGRFVGALGVEYSTVFPGSNGVTLDVVQVGQIPARRLETDHEARVVDIRLRKKSR